jgi:hypothetical protein
MEGGKKRILGLCDTRGNDVFGIDSVFLYSGIFS